MLSGLRLRLLASYLLVLVITLGTIAATLLIIFNTRPAPPEPAIQRLTSVAINTWDEVYALQRRQQGSGTFRPRALLLGQLLDELRTLAVDRGVRIMIVELAPEDAVLARFDSAQRFETGDRILGSFAPHEIPVVLLTGLPGELRTIDAVAGSFADIDGSEWLFVGFAQLTVDQRALPILFAAPRQTQSLQAALADLGTDLLPLLLQAAVVGVAVAIVLATLISRNIARPLRTAAEAAAQVADGNYSQLIPMRGPTEVRAVAEAFNQMSAKVEAAQTAQKDFLANVSHDLKTPLTSIQGFSQAIIDGAANDPVQAATIIYDEAARLNRMVVELTDLARLQAGRLSMKADAIDMGQLAAAIGQRLALVAREQGIKLTVDAGPMPPIAGDGDRLAQVLTNLISNAIKYTPSGGSVHVATKQQANGVEVTVRDTGVGIPADELPRIFERFYQINKARGPQRGTGLGLAIVREIVLAHGGTITAMSDGPQRGSTFTVWLPSPQLSTIIRRK
ncbi:MAG: HAMP domain-containing histidine kinase [Chloroflexi bacterium]|nr:HAMP domain-containing histidine kinase [Chloroflexota bacterium]